MAPSESIRSRETPVRAYSYLRFSTPEQEKGDSFRRQVELAREYAESRGWELDDTLNLHDRGKSAFRSQNAETGALASFLQAVSSGHVPNGSYLLVESLDRLSRDEVMIAVARFIDLVQAGIAIVTLADRREYSAETLRQNPTELIVSILVMMRAHEESQSKSRRLTEVWKAKRNRAANAKLTKRCPAWLQLNEERTAFNEIKARTAVIRLMFAMAAKGHGQHAIAKALEAKGIPTWGDHNSKRRAAAFWHRSYVKKILTNPAVIGTYIPHKVDYNNPEKRKRRIPLPAIDGYFPCIVKRETFQRVQDLLKGKTSQPRGRQADAPKQNVLAGLARCHICGSAMTRVSKGAGLKAGPPYLVCTKAKSGAAKHYKAIRLSDVEDALQSFSGQLLKQSLPKDADRELKAQREVLIDQIAGNGMAIEKLLTSIEKHGPSRAAAEKLARREAIRDQLEDKLTEVMRKIDRAGAHNLGKRILALLAALAKLSDHRLGKPHQVLSVTGKVSKAKPTPTGTVKRWIDIDLPASAGDNKLGAVTRTVEGRGQNIESIGRANKALRDLLSQVIVDYESGRLMLHWHHMPVPSEVPFQVGIRSAANSPTEVRRTVTLTRPSKNAPDVTDVIDVTFEGNARKPLDE